MIDYGFLWVWTIGYDVYGRMNFDVLKVGIMFVSSIIYGYDVDNNIIFKNIIGVVGVGNNIYVYDQFGRLIFWMKGIIIIVYGWDANSNRTKVIIIVGIKFVLYDERNWFLDDGIFIYIYLFCGVLLMQIIGMMIEVFSFDAFDWMIIRSDRDFIYDVFDCFV